MSEPAMLRHCTAVYNAMREEAKEVRFDSEDGPKGIVYEGNLTTLITQKLSLSNPYYTSVTRMLKGMSCVRQLRRGGGSTPSQWELIKEPTSTLYQAYMETLPNQPRYVTQTELEEVWQRVRDQGTRLNRVEQAVGIEP